MRIAIIGTSATGKSSLAQAIAQKFKLKYIEQDRHYWLPGWQVTPKEQFFTSVVKEISEDSWVICGNYSSTQEEVWKRATHVIWLNFPLRTALSRGICRTFRRVLNNLECCNGNYESLRRVLRPKDSIIWYIFKSHRRLESHYTSSKLNGKFDHLIFLEFKSPTQAEKWLNAL
jgi:adenylate kinase family enzyme